MAVKCTTFPDPRLEREESGVVLCAAEPCCVLPRLDGRHPQGTRGQGQGCSVFPICLLSRSSVRICLESPSESRGLAPALGKPLRLVGDQPGSHRCAQTQVTGRSASAGVGRGAWHLWEVSVPWDSEKSGSGASW